MVWFILGNNLVLIKWQNYDFSLRKRKRHWKATLFAQRWEVNAFAEHPPSLYEAGKLTLSPAALYSGSMWLKFLPCCVCMDLAAPPEYSNNALGSPGQTNLEPVLKPVQSLTYLLINTFSHSLFLYFLNFLWLLCSLVSIWGVMFSIASSPMTLD